MTTVHNKIAVIYLAWLPYGIGHFKNFIESYLLYDAGHDHKLVIAFNGAESAADKDAYIKLLNNHKIIHAQYLNYKSGQDISVYRQAVTAVDADLFLFLNTYSQLKTANWLLHYKNNFKDNVGLVGASGSYANYLTALTTKLRFDLKSKMSISNKINQLKYLVKIFLLYGYRFKKFPSPHVRTNAFFTSREIFLSLKNNDVKDKIQAYFFENGKNSMTEQVLRMGYRCVIIDKNGKAFDIPAWKESGLFWNKNQEALLVSDNQTRIYDQIPENEREIFRKIAWGNDTGQSIWRSRLLF